MSNKIITKQKSNKTTKVKLLGITIYKKTKKPDLEKIYIIGIPFYAKKKRQSSEKEYFLGIRISKSLNKDILLEEIKKIKILVDVKISKLEKKINCQNLHAKTFTKYKNIFQKKELVIVGAGPSLSNYIPLNNKIHIGVNRVYQYDKINFDFLFLQDFNASKNYIDDFLKYKCPKFLGVLEDVNISIPEYYYNQPKVEKYFTQYPFSGFSTDISNNPLGDYASVIFPALNFAVYTHPKKIYLVGCDCNLNGYWNGQPMKIQKDILANCLEHNKRGWSDFKKFINYHYPDIEIISINPVGLKGLFKDIYTQEYLNEHPEIDRNKVSILEES